MGEALLMLGSSPSASRAISKSLKTIFITFLSIGVIWNLSGGSWAALWGPQEVLFGVDVAQREDLKGYFRFLQKTEKGQRQLTLGVGCQWLLTLAVSKWS